VVQTEWIGSTHTAPPMPLLLQVEDACAFYAGAYAAWSPTPTPLPSHPASPLARSSAAQPAQRDAPRVSASASPPVQPPPPLDGGWSDVGQLRASSAPATCGPGASRLGGGRAGGEGPGAVSGASPTHPGGRQQLGSRERSLSLEPWGKEMAAALAHAAGVHVGMARAAPAAAAAAAAGGSRPVPPLSRTSTAESAGLAEGTAESAGPGGGSPGGDGVPGAWLTERSGSDGLAQAAAAEQLQFRSLPPSPSLGSSNTWMGGEVALSRGNGSVDSAANGAAPPAPASPSKAERAGSLVRTGSGSGAASPRAGSQDGLLLRAASLAAEQRRLLQEVQHHQQQHHNGHHLHAHAHAHGLRLQPQLRVAGLPGQRASGGGGGGGSSARRRGSSGSSGRPACPLCRQPLAGDAALAGGAGAGRAAAGGGACNGACSLGRLAVEVAAARQPPRPGSSSSSLLLQWGASPPTSPLSTAPPASGGAGGAGEVAGGDEVCLVGSAAAGQLPGSCLPLVSHSYRGWTLNMTFADPALPRQLRHFVKVSAGSGTFLGVRGLGSKVLFFFFGGRGGGHGAATPAGALCVKASFPIACVGPPPVSSPCAPCLYLLDRHALAPPPARARRRATPACCACTSRACPAGR